MTIYLAADHGGFALKEAVKKHLQEQGKTIVDCGNDHLDTNDDYPDFVMKAAAEVAKDPESRGIIFGGSGQGEMMAANRVKGVRCMLFYAPATPREAIDVTGAKSDDPFTMLTLSREHNNSNMLSLGGRFLTEADVMRAVDTWLAAPFSGAERHQRRINKFN